MYDVIVFKDEDEVEGEAVGPVVGYTHEELEASHDGLTVPFDPDRPRRWVSRPQALALAAELGAEFRES